MVTYCHACDLPESVNHLRKPHAARAASRTINQPAFMHCIDSHCHLDDSRFDADRPQVLARARDAGVSAIVIPGVRADRWSGQQRIAQEHRGVFHALGIHPLFVGQHRDADLDRLRDLLRRTDGIAVGECGLDARSSGNRDIQRRWFVAQIELAVELKLPLIVHALRGDIDEVLGLLRRHRPAAGGVLHSFAGSEQQARQLWDLGFHIGIGGPATHARANRLRSLVAGMPLEYLLAETDAPDQTDASHKGQRNEPAWLVSVLSSLANLRNMEAGEMAAITASNACGLFRLPAAGLAATS